MKMNPNSLQIYYKTDIGKKRKVNEDTVLYANLGVGYLLAVADGLGGHSAGDVASKIAMVELEECLKASLMENSPQEAMQTAITKANREIYLLSREKPAYAGMGTTLVAALISGNTALIANVGDSRAYMIKEEIRQITKDHSLVHELMESGIITKEQAFDHPQKNIVTRTLGTGSDVSPDFYEERFTEGKTLLLCSDGLTDMLRDKEILEIVQSSTGLDDACARLIEKANEKGGKDNITIALASESCAQEGCTVTTTV